MATVRANTFEGSTVGVALTTGFTDGGDAPSGVLGPPSGPGPVFTADAMHGSRALDCSASGVQAVGQWGGITAQTTFGYRFYLKRLATPSAGHQLVRCGSSAGQFHGLNLASTNKLQITHGSGGTFKANTTTVLTQDVWYRIEAYGAIATSTTGSLTFKLFLGDSTTALETLTYTDLDFGTSGMVSFWIGKLGSSGSSSLIVDDIVVTNTAAAPGPATTPADLRTPSSVVSNPGSWTVLGGAADIPTGLADSDDTTGGRSPNDPSGAAVTLGFLALTPSKPVRVSGRHASPAGAGNISRVYTLKQGSTAIASRTYNPLPETVTAFSFTTTTSETAAITDWSALSVTVTDTLV